MTVRSAKPELDMESSSKLTVAKEKPASKDLPPMAKKAKKGSPESPSDAFSEIWVVKTLYVDDRGAGTETLIGAFSSKESAIKNAKVAMEDLEEEEYEIEDNSNTIADDGGVVFSSSSNGQELFEVSIKKVSLDKQITSATFRFI